MRRGESSGRGTGVVAVRSAMRKWCMKEGRAQSSGDHLQRNETRTQKLGQYIPLLIGVARGRGQSERQRNGWSQCGMQKKKVVVVHSFLQEGRRARATTGTSKRPYRQQAENTLKSGQHALS